MRRSIESMMQPQLSELFFRQVHQRPHETAVVFHGGVWTYDVLAQRVKALAADWRAAGVQKGMRVGINARRTPEVVAGILAAVRLGAAYVPIDASYPQERRGLMAREACLDFLAGEDRQSDGPGSSQISLEPGASAREPEPELGPGPDPDNLIYIIFTSGSTGTPKGAAVYYKGFARLLDWFTTEFAIGPTDRTLLVSSPSFDLTQKNFFAPLISGGQLVLAGRDHYDPEHLLELIATHGITLLNCTPSTFYPLVEAASGEQLERLRSLRCVFLGGEPIAAQRLRRWTTSPWFRGAIVNTYGPTECSDIVAFHRLTEDELAGGSPVALGCAIPGAVLRIADHDGADASLGELQIGGDGVGAGYVNDAALTATRFYRDANGSLFYRSGDLVKRRNDGLLEFVGRVDHQVKIRGNRVELSEVEAAILRHSGIRDTIVVAAFDQLIAFLVPSITSTPDRAALRAALAAILPPYMIPSRFEVIDEFPLSPNGKADRQALAERALAIQPTAAPVPPDAPTEVRIRAIWQDVLRTGRIGLDDNFFDLGGTSLSAVVVQQKLEQELRTKLSVTILFERPTIRMLAEAVGTGATLLRDAAERARRQQQVFRRRQMSKGITR